VHRGPCVPLVCILPCKYLWVLFSPLPFVDRVYVALSVTASHLCSPFIISTRESYSSPPPDHLCLSWVHPRFGVCIPFSYAQRFIITGAHCEGVLVKIASSRYRQTYNLRLCRVFPPTVESLWEQLEELDETSPTLTNPQPPLTEEELAPLFHEASPLDPLFLTAHLSTSSIPPLTDSHSSHLISASVVSPAPAPSTPMAAPSMPSRGDPKAPKFDLNRPRELHLYFEELVFHFTQASIVDHATKKLMSILLISGNRSPNSPTQL